MLVTFLLAQSLIFPRLLDRHWVHAVTKPAVAWPVMEGLKAVGVAKPVAMAGGLLLPELVGELRWERKSPGHWKQVATLKDMLADTWAAAAWSVPWQLHGVKRWLLLAGMSLVYIGGLHRWAKP